MFCTVWQNIEFFGTTKGIPRAAVALAEEQRALRIVFNFWPKIKNKLSVLRELSGS